MPLRSTGISPTTSRSVSVTSSWVAAYGPTRYGFSPVSIVVPRSMRSRWRLIVMEKPTPDRAGIAITGRIPPIRHLIAMAAAAIAIAVAAAAPAHAHTGASTDAYRGAGAWIDVFDHSLLVD